MNSAISALSSDPSLSVSRQRRLAEILDQYLVGLEQGLPPQPERLIAKYPDLAEPLRSYLDGLDLLQHAAAEFHQVKQGTLPVGANCVEGQLGDFAILRELGRGGMGVVYEARQISLDRRVALKVLPFAAVLDPKCIARFKNEAQAAAQVQHPNIVPVFAVGSERGVYYYAMQYVDGQALDQAIDELRREAGITCEEPTDARLASSEDKTGQRGMSPSTGKSLLTKRSPKDAEYFRTVARLGIQAAEALHAAHEYGVVHRDIKPSNLLIDAHGKLWVTDFGLAQVQSDVSLTKTGDIVGTMRYMSPEQALGNSALVDQRTDIYSLGATLYELITLQVVHPGQDHATLLRQMEQQEPRRPRSLNSNVPADLENIVLKAISKSRDDRYATAQEVADDLARFVDGKPTIAKPPTLWTRTHKWARRHSQAVVIAISVAMLAVVGLVVSAALITRAKLDTDNALVEAKTNLQRANDNYRQARQAVDEFGAILAEELANVPGVESVRKKLLAQTLEYYEKFIEISADDPSLRPDLAVTLTKVATINEQIGSHEQAIEAYQRARRLFYQLVEDEPRSSTHRGSLALCQNNLGLLLAHAGRIDEAREAFSSALEIQRQLIEQSPQDTKYARHLAQSNTNVGLLQIQTGELANAKTSLLAAIEQQLQITELQPDDARNLRNLSFSYGSLSQLCSHGDMAEAIRYSRKALSIQQDLCDAHPRVGSYRSDLARGFNNLGALQSRRDQLAEAMESYRRSIGIQRRLVGASPQVKAYRHDLAISHNNLGLVQSKSTLTSAAEDSFRQAVAIQRELVREYPDELNYLSSMGGIYNNLAMVLQTLGRYDEAATSYERAIHYQRRAYHRAPQVSRVREFLEKTYDNYARILRGLDRLDEAARMSLSRKEIFPDDPHKLYSVAKQLASIHQQVRENEKHSLHQSFVASQSLADDAVETLQQAVQAGYDLAMVHTDPSLEVLHGHPAFEKLIEKRSQLGDLPGTSL